MANPILGTSVMAVPVTALYGALIMFLAVGLAIYVSSLRRRLEVPRGDGGHDEIARAVRAHGNLTEHAPLIVLLLLIAELCGGAPTALHLIGATLLVARIAHAFGMIRKVFPGVVVGALLTYLVELGLAGYVLWLRPWS